ncbi:AraC family transcriptional regulator [Siphonobacter sp. BAB-5385]|uniref:helix-turn-helix domain-containing protein n=1 Tax=unclassified Siphonobacter TaxID=2635712 RepID=UPI000B9E3A1C|nr:MULTISPECIES: AraC family transcriptional regulator [unclassified Siphonobacter]OZI08095.1 AraC family transcriptional regulator [Siphonobacter sp. BAB-5385]PMD99301.1 AraC family transcriptional regulator [Siphonobacter sp. BAB-5405]
MTFEHDTNERIRVYELDPSNSPSVFEVKATDLTFIWNTGERLDLTVDKVPYRLARNQIIFLTEFHHIDSIELESARMVRFNQPFYCIINHDNEVGSKGFLFFGASGIPIISIDEAILWEFDISWQLFEAEMQRTDILKKDMLQSILKRMLILSARILRKSTDFHKLEKGQSDLIREFNYLVERHFTEHHDVAFYASQLNKSPKTISNVFSVISSRGPQHIIHDRIMMHARRQIGYTNLSIKEIAYELGYEDIHSFSRFFKKKEGISPLQYREKFLANTTSEGKIATTSGIYA